MLSYSQVRTFTPGTSFKWSIAMIGGPGPASESSFNILGGQFIPATKVTIDDVTTEHSEIQVSPNFKLSIPVFSAPISSLQINAIDDNNGTIRNAYSAWANAKMLPSNRAVKLENYYKQVKITIYNNDLSEAYSRVLYVVPKGNLSLDRDNSTGADEIALDFQVVGDDS